MTTGSFNRKRYYTLLAVGKQQLGWDNEFYYGIWLPMMGASKKQDQYSASTLTDKQLVAALSDMQSKGFQLKPANGNTIAQSKSGAKKQRKLAPDAQSRKIRSLWLTLADMGVVRDRSETALCHFVRGLTNIEALQWLNTAQASRVIESLKNWQQREQNKRGAAQ